MNGARTVAFLLRLSTLAIVFALGAWAHASGALAMVWSMRGDLWFLTRRQIELIAIAGGISVIIGIPLGILVTRRFARRFEPWVMQILNIGAAIPTLAKLALAMTFLGIGTPPAVVGLVAVALLPIVQNTVAGHRAVPPHLIEAASGMGMTDLQVLFSVELPNALYVTLAGVRIAFAITVGTAPLAFLIGGTSLGELIFTGIALNDWGQMLLGAAATALLAVLVDAALGLLQYVIVPRGVRPAR